MRYREGFHIYSHREDAAKLSSKDFVRPVWWFDLNAAGYDGADGKSLRPVIVARYMVFFDQEEMPEIKHERLQELILSQILFSLCQSSINLLMVDMLLKRIPLSK